MKKKPITTTSNINKTLVHNKSSFPYSSNHTAGAKTGKRRPINTLSTAPVNSSKAKTKVQLKKNDSPHWKSSGTITLEALSNILGKMDGPKFVEYLKNLGVGNTLPLIDIYLYIPAELVTNFSLFSKKLNSFSIVGRTFTAVREDNFIKIDIFSFTENLSSPVVTKQLATTLNQKFLDPISGLRIYSGEMAITCANSSLFVLHTVNLRPQVKMIIYNSTQKVAALAHLPNHRAFKEITQFLMQKIANPTDLIEITISAASTTPKAFQTTIKNDILSLQALYQNIRVNICNDYKTLAINAKTGEIQSDFEFINFDERNTNFLSEKVFSVHAKINLDLIFDGRTSRLVENPLLVGNSAIADIGLLPLLPSFKRHKSDFSVKTSCEKNCGEILMQLRNSC